MTQSMIPYSMMDRMPFKYPISLYISDSSFTRTDGAPGLRTFHKKGTCTLQVQA